MKAAQKMVEASAGSSACRREKASNRLGCSAAAPGHPASRLPELAGDWVLPPRLLRSAFSEIAEDDHQQVAEVVCDAAAELADGPRASGTVGCSWTRFSSSCASLRSGEVSGVTFAKADDGSALVFDPIDDDGRPKARAILAHAPAIGFKSPLFSRLLECICWDIGLEVFRCRRR